jgi:hypothetical protein
MKYTTLKGIQGTITILANGQLQMLDMFAYRSNDEK